MLRARTVDLAFSPGGGLLEGGRAGVGSSGLGDGWAGRVGWGGVGGYCYRYRCCTVYGLHTSIRGMSTNKSHKGASHIVLKSMCT